MISKSYYFPSLIVPLCLGFIAFYFIIGLNVLDVTNVIWLQYGDPLQHYLGWAFYRDSSWVLPIGSNPRYGLDISSSVVYTDSIPILALFFKLISAYLPTPFQYFGLWILVCFILQAVFAWLIFSLVLENNLQKTLACSLLLFVPPFLLRFSQHIALSSHFLILAAFFLYFADIKKFKNFFWGLILIISALIHFYLFTSIYIIWLSYIVSHLRSKTTSFKNLLIYFFLINLLILFFAWQIGYFMIPSTGVIQTNTYGIGRLNLLGFIDPNNWSFFLPDIPESPDKLHQHQLDTRIFESFNFIGSGFILLLIFCLLKFKSFFYIFLTFLNKYIVLCIFLFILFFISVSNSIGIGKIEFHFELPFFVDSILEIWRASARLSWPILYLLLIGIIFSIVKLYTKSQSIILISIALCLQIFDSSSGWLPIKANKYNVLPSKTLGHKYVNPFWTEAAPLYKQILQVPFRQDWTALPIGSYAASNHLETNAVYFARYDQEKINASNDKLLISLEQGKYSSDAIYIFDDNRYFLHAYMQHNSKYDLISSVDGNYVFAPNFFKKSKLNYSDFKLKKFEFSSVNHFPKLIFEKGSPDIQYLSSGWSQPESWGTWSDGNFANINLPTNPGFNLNDYSIKFIARSLISKDHPQQKFDIFLNNQFKKSITLNHSDNNCFIVNFDNTSLPHGQRLAFRFHDAIEPKSLGIEMNDVRKLSIGIISATIELKIYNNCKFK